MQILRQSTQIDVRVGPFVDVGDGFTPETGVTLSGADEAELLKADGAATVDISGATWAAVTGADGWYDLTLTTSHTDTVGTLEVVVNDDSVCLPVVARFQIVEEATFDFLYASGATPIADINAEADTAISDAALATAANLATVDTNVDTILVDTAELQSVLSAGISAETHNDTLIEQLQTLAAVVEHQRGAHTHQPIGNIFFVDPTNGDTHAAGNRGGITDPYSTVQDCHDNAVTDSNHDMIILLSGAAAGPTTLTENVTLSKRYLFVRGPGRDFIWTRSGAGDTITVTADGIELSGFQLNTAATGSGNGITGTSVDFLKVCNLWINNTQGDAIQLTDCDNFVIHECELQASGQSGAGHGIQVLAGAGQTGNYGKIHDNILHDVAGDGIQLDTTGGGTIDAVVIRNNVIEGCTDDGIDIVDSGTTSAVIVDNRFANITSNDIEDAGTSTVQINNEQSAKHSIATEARLAELDAANIPADVDNILTDTADMQPKLGTPVADISADIATVDANVDAVLVDTGTTIPATLGTPAGADMSADIAAVKVDTAATLVDTAEIGAAGAGLTEAGGTGDHLTAVPWNAAWDAEVQSEVDDALNTAISDSTPADGSIGSLRETMLQIARFLMESSVSGTTVTVKKEDGSTTAMTFTLDDGTTPTSITRAT